jgi:methylase of polypeptide subunit release factors
MKDKKILADLGTGSGILPIVLKENGGFKGKTHCFDSVENSIECAKMNMELYGML